MSPHALNPPQQEAVDHGQGPLLILAGAGSGKTRVITTRLARLIAEGVPPYRILAVTFTNKAAGEMRDRVDHLTDGRAREAWIGTFHSISARLCRLHADLLGLPKGFVIFDDDDQKALVTRLLKELNIGDRFATPRSILSAIDGAKNKGEGPEQYKPHDYFSDLVAKVYPLYQQRLLQSGAVDFGDLLLNLQKLLRREDDAGVRLRKRYEHVLVDEFQDTNRVQYNLVKLLSSTSRNLVVVGDDDQAIYGWRGADVRNILDFERDHPDARVVKLEQNYRSTQVILDAANSIIAKNPERRPKRLFTEQGAGEPILCVAHEDERREADFVVRTLRKLCDDEGRDPSDFAVFYRTHAQSRVLEEALRAHGVGYRVFGGVRFFDRAEVRDILAYLRLVANPADELALERAINRPARGIGDTTFERIVQRARREDASVWETLVKIVDHGDPDITAAPRKKLMAFRALVDQLRAEPGLPSEITSRVVEQTGYIEKLALDGSQDSQDRIQNVLELIGSMRDYERDGERAPGDPPTLEAYLERVALVTPGDQDARGVTLMTVHASKGLEFPVVFVTGLEDGIFPSTRNGDDDDELAEERRLAYVALTRARERLFLTYAKLRRIYGGEVRVQRESRFLRDIPASIMVRPYEVQRTSDFAPTRFGRPEPRVVDRGGSRVVYDQDADSGSSGGDEVYETGFALGQKVFHAQFGEGVVRGLSGSGPQLKLIVYFPEIGPKTVVARFVEVM